MNLFTRSAAKTRVGLGASLAVVAALVMSACGSSDDDEPAATATDAGSSSAAPADFGDISVQYSWIKNEEFAGEFYAYANGYYDEAGFGEVTGISGPDTGVAKLLSGEVQVALSDAASVGQAVAEQGAPLKIIATTFQLNPFTILSAEEKTPIRTPEDMIGKKIGVDASNASVFSGFLAANGIDPSSVTIVPGNFDGPAQIEAGTVDGYVAYITNEAIVLAADGLTPVRVDFAENNFPYVAESYAVTDEYLAANHDLLKAFLIAEIKGWSDTFKNPTDDTVKVILAANAAAGSADANAPEASFGALTEDDSASIAAGLEGEHGLMSTDETKANGLFTISDALKAATVKSLGEAGWTVTADQLFDTSIIDEIYAEFPELIAYGG